MNDQKNSALDEQRALVAEDISVFTLKQIARGRKDCGRPLGGQYAQHLARLALVSLQEDW